METHKLYFTIFILVLCFSNTSSTSFSEQKNNDIEESTNPKLSSEQFNPENLKGAYIGESDVFVADFGDFRYKGDYYGKQYSMSINPYFSEIIDSGLTGLEFRRTYYDLQKKCFFAYPGEISPVTDEDIVPARYIYRIIETGNLVYLGDLRFDVIKDSGPPLFENITDEEWDNFEDISDVNDFWYNLGLYKIVSNNVSSEYFDEVFSQDYTHSRITIDGKVAEMVFPVVIELQDNLLVEYKSYSELFGTRVIPFNPDYGFPWNELSSLDIGVQCGIYNQTWAPSDWFDEYPDNNFLYNYTYSSLGWDTGAKYFQFDIVGLNGPENYLNITPAMEIYGINFEFYDSYLLDIQGKYRGFSRFLEYFDNGFNYLYGKDAIIDYNSHPDYSTLMIPQYNDWNETSGSYQDFYEEEFYSFRDFRWKLDLDLEIYLDDGTTIERRLSFSRNLLSTPHTIEGFSENFDFSTDEKRWGYLQTGIKCYKPDFIFPNQPATIQFEFNPSGAESASYSLIPIACKYEIYEGENLNRIESLDSGPKIELALTDTTFYSFDITYFGMLPEIKVIFKMWYMLSDGFGGFDWSGLYESKAITLRPLTNHFDVENFKNEKSYYYPGLSEEPVLTGNLESLSISMEQSETLFFGDRMRLKFQISLDMKANVTDTIHFEPTSIDFVRILEGTWLEVFYQRKWLLSRQISGNSLSDNLVKENMDKLERTIDLSSLMWKCSISNDSNDEYHAKLDSNFLISYPTSIDWEKIFEDIRIDCYQTYTQDQFLETEATINSILIENPGKNQFSIKLFKASGIYPIAEIISILGSAFAVTGTFSVYVKRRFRKGAKAFPVVSDGLLQQYPTVSKIFHNLVVYPTTEDNQLSTKTYNTILVSDKGKIVELLNLPPDLIKYEKNSLEYIQYKISDIFGHVIPFGEEVEMWDLQGSVVIPSLYDAGLWVSSVGNYFFVFDCKGNSISEVFEKLPKSAPYAIIVSPDNLTELTLLDGFQYPIFVFQDKEIGLNSFAFSLLKTSKRILSEIEFHPTDQFFVDLIKDSGMANDIIFSTLNHWKRTGYGSILMLDGENILDNNQLRYLIEKSNLDPLPHLIIAVRDVPKRIIPNPLGELEYLIYHGGSPEGYIKQLERTSLQPLVFFDEINPTIIKLLSQLTNPLILIENKNNSDLGTLIEIAKNRGRVILSSDIFFENPNLTELDVGIASFGINTDPIDTIRKFYRKFSFTNISELISIIRLFTYNNYRALEGKNEHPLSKGEDASFSVLECNNIDAIINDDRIGAKTVIRGVPPLDYSKRSILRQHSIAVNESSIRESIQPSSRLERFFNVFSVLVAVLIGAIPSIFCAIGKNEIFSNGSFLSLLSIFSFVSIIGISNFAENLFWRKGSTTESIAIVNEIISKALLIAGLILFSIPWLGFILCIFSLSVSHPDPIDGGRSIKTLFWSLLLTVIMAVLDLFMLVNRFWIHLLMSFVIWFSLIEIFINHRTSNPVDLQEKNIWKTRWLVFITSIICEVILFIANSIQFENSFLDLSQLLDSIGVSAILLYAILKAFNVWKNECDNPFTLQKWLPWVLVGIAILAFLGVSMISNIEFLMVLVITMLLSISLMEYLLGKDSSIEQTLLHVIWLPIVFLAPQIPSLLLYTLIGATLIAIGLNYFYQVRREDEIRFSRIGLDFLAFALISLLSNLTGGNGISRILFLLVVIVANEYGASILPSKTRNMAFEEKSSLLLFEVIFTFSLILVSLNLDNFDRSIGPLVLVWGTICFMITTIWGYGENSNKSKKISISILLLSGIVVSFIFGLIRNRSDYGFLNSINAFSFSFYLFVGMNIALYFMNFCRNSLFSRNSKMDFIKKSISMLVISVLLLGFVNILLGVILQLVRELIQSIFVLLLNSLFFTIGFVPTTMICHFARKSLLNSTEEQIEVSSAEDKFNYTKIAFGPESNFIPLIGNKCTENLRAVNIEFPSRNGKKISVWLPRSAVLGEEKYTGNSKNGFSFFKIKRTYLMKNPLLLGDIVENYNIVPDNHELPLSEVKIPKLPSEILSFSKWLESKKAKLQEWIRTNFSNLPLEEIFKGFLELRIVDSLLKRISTEMQSNLHVSPNSMLEDGTMTNQNLVSNEQEEYSNETFDSMLSEILQKIIN